MKKSVLIERLNLRLVEINGVRNVLRAALGNIPCIENLDLTLVVLEDIRKQLVAAPVTED